MIVATNQLPPLLKGTGEPPTPQFLVGYRNVLVISASGRTEWGLVRAPKYCGKGFCFPITEEEAHTVQSAKAEDELLEVMGTNYIIHKQPSSIQHPVQPLSLDQTKQLLAQVEAVDSIGLNLLKSAFESLLEFNRVVGA